MRVWRGEEPGRRTAGVLAGLLIVALIATACGSSESTIASETTNQDNGETSTTIADRSSETVDGGSSEGEGTDGQETDRDRDRDETHGDDWIFESVGGGLLEIDGETIGDELDAVLSLDVATSLPTLTIDYGAATAEIQFGLPHYEITGATIDIDGEVHELSEISVGYPSTAIIVEANLAGPDSQRVVIATTYIAGTTSVDVVANQAFIRGQIGAHTAVQVQQLVDNHPSVDTLVLTDIDGSVQDEIEQAFGRVDAWNTVNPTLDTVRDHGFTTVLPANGQVVDDGLLLFAAGLERIVEATEGAFYEQEIGALRVRARCCGGPDDRAHEADQYSAVHEADVRRWSDLLGEQAGTALALYLVQASVDAPLELSRAEIDAFHLSTTPAVLTTEHGPTPPDAVPFLFGVDTDIAVQRPEELLAAIADSFNANQAAVEEGRETATPLIVADTDRTLGYMLIQGGLDDSVGGQLATLSFEGDDEFGWVLTEVTQRFLCSRGSSGGACI